MAKCDSLSRVLHGQVYTSDKNITQNLVLAGTLCRECSCFQKRAGGHCRQSRQTHSKDVSELVHTAPVSLCLLVSPSKARILGSSSFHISAQETLGRGREGGAELLCPSRDALTSCTPTASPRQGSCSLTHQNTSCEDKELHPLCVLQRGFYSSAGALSSSQMNPFFGIFMDSFSYLLTWFFYILWRCPPFIAMYCRMKSTFNS